MPSLKNFKYIKANSLVESVIAIAIISICILVAFLVYLNVIKQNKSIAFYEAKHKVELLYNASVITKNFDDDTFEYKDYSIEKSVDISDEEHIARIDFKVITKHNTFTIHKLVKL